ncbi:unnamed protein product [Polarella glacialis]|uniref:FZ domain-containing protein n=1 Tax=Polarella glacialis TaxID=89957 RepID=A0A813K948_POLGL|nr:unnamed protein product [Polarella glacialis]
MMRGTSQLQLRFQAWVFVLCLGERFLPGLGGIFDGEEPNGLAGGLETLRPLNWSVYLGRSECEIPARSGRINGVCMESEQELGSQISFCKDVVKYRACVPATQPLWPHWNATKKDALLAHLFKEIVEARLAKEMNVTADIFVELHLLSNPGCFTALRNALCWYNFPKCNDQNVSLPLCQSSCEQYYGKCLHKAGADGLYEACSAPAVAGTGLFKSEAPGRDQILAPDNETCESTGELAKTYLEDVVQQEIWLLTPSGMAMMAFVALLIFGVAYCLLVPYGLRAYVQWGTRQILLQPVKLFRKLPPINGRNVLLLFGVLFLVFIVVGVIWRQRPGMSLSDRFGRKLAEDAGPNATTEITDESVFIPKAANYKASVSQPLTKRQMRQLIGSCSCTGSSWRKSEPSSAVLAVAAAVGLLASWGPSRPPTPTSQTR